MRTAVLVVLVPWLTMAQDAWIEGRVVDRVTKQPIQGATVTTRRVARPVETDAHGRFRFEKLAPGRYGLSLSRVGYVDTSHTGHQVMVQTGEPAEIALEPTGHMRGVLRGEDHEPIPGALVYAEAEGTEAFSGETDHAGLFTLEHLRAGSYQLRFVLPSAAAKKFLRVDQASGDRYGYPPSWSEANPVTVTAGVTAEGQAFRVRRQLLVELSGQLVDEATKEALANGDVELQLEGGNHYSDPALKRQPTRGGTFRYDAVPAGRHTLLVYRGSGPGLAWATPVDVGKKGKTGWQVLVPQFVAVRGTLTIESSDTTSVLTPRITLLGHGDTQQAMISGGEFNFSAVPPGMEYKLGFSWSLTGPTASGDPKRLLEKGMPVWYVKRIVAGGRELPADRRFSITGPTELALTLSDVTGKVRPEVMDSEGKAVPEALVLVRATHMTQAMASGNSQSLPVGEAELAAFPAGTTMKEALRRGCSEKTTVNIRASETATVRLKLCP